MPELPPQICSYILADKSRYAYGADEIHEMPRMRKTKLAEKSSYKRRVRQIKAPHYRQVRRRRGAFLYFDIDCNAGLEFHGEVVVEDGIFLDEFFDQSLIKLCYVGFLPGERHYRLE